MARLWHPHIKDLSIERDKTEVAAYVAAGWLKGKPRREFVEVAPEESTQAVLEETREEKPSKKASESPSTGDGEAN